VYIYASRSETDPDFQGKACLRLQKQKGKIIPIFKRAKGYLRIADHPALSDSREEPGRVARCSENSDR